MHPTRVKNLLTAKQDAHHLLQQASDRLTDGCEHGLAMNVEANIISLDYRINEFINTHLPIVEKRK